MRPKRKSPDEGARGARGLSGLSNGSRLSYFWFNCLLHRQHAHSAAANLVKIAHLDRSGPLPALTHTQDCLGLVRGLLWVNRYTFAKSPQCPLRSTPDMVTTAR
jgi:hypothetical protein